MGVGCGVTKALGQRSARTVGDGLGPNDGWMEALGAGDPSLPLGHGRVSVGALSAERRARPTGRWDEQSLGPPSRSVSDRRREAPGAGTGGAASDCGFGEPGRTIGGVRIRIGSCCRQGTRLAFDARSRDGAAYRRAFDERFVASPSPPHRSRTADQLEHDRAAGRGNPPLCGIGETGVDA